MSRRTSGVGHEDIDRAERLGGGGDEARGSGHRAHVGHQGHGRRTDARRGVLDPAAVAPADGHVGPFGGQRGGRGEPEPGRCGGDGGGAPTQSQFHRRHRSGPGQ